jgi:Putative metallopeptidase
MKHFKVCFLLLFYSFFIISCKQNTKNIEGEQTTQSTVKKRSGQAEIDFKLSIEKPENEEFNYIYDLLQKTDVLENFINDINERIEFPGEVVIRIAECDEINAFYEADNSTITICYEFLDHAMSIQDEDVPKEERLLNAAAFTLLHEMGHAMVDKLNLPITGKEENAVDELAMVILMSDSTDVAYVAAIEGAMQFYEDALDEDLEKYPYYDVHAPSLERYYDMLTIIVGAEPTTAEEFVGEGKYQLHPDRAESAEDEYYKKLDSWKSLLGDAWKE